MKMCILLVRFYQQLTKPLEGEGRICEAVNVAVKPFLQILQGEIICQGQRRANLHDTTKTCMLDILLCLKWKSEQACNPFLVLAYFHFALCVKVLQHSVQNMHHKRLQQQPVIPAPAVSSHTMACLVSTRNLQAQHIQSGSSIACT